ncbi:diguanylate cyclase VdcA [Peptococcaceae bacterium CEB3]|nr:diguanylate cyclase VdcA [Peptococcaceae bacterium CEB3]
MLPAPNPIGCENKIREVLGTGSATVCLADADGLKGINDKYGHLAGNEYLEHVLDELRGCFPEFIWDRYGGDEFIGVSPDRIVLTPEQAKRETVEIFNQSIKIGYSLGVVYTAPNDTAELALAMADAAMYEAKHVHHGGLLMFEPQKRVGLIQTDWPADWYVPLVRGKIRFFLGYEQGGVDFVFTRDPDILEGIFVESADQLCHCIKHEPAESDDQDEFGEWGMPIENLEWRTKVPESEWEQIEDDQPVRIRLERDGRATAKPEAPKPPIPKFSAKRQRHKISIPIPKIPIPKIEKPEQPGTPPPVPSDSGDGGAFQGKIIWIWGERGHEVDYAFAQYLARFGPVLYLDGDLANPQQPGNWSDCWALGTPALAPSGTKQEGNLWVWGLGKRPPRPKNAKALWENALYSLNTVDRAIVVGAGKTAPPPYVDRIVFVTEDNGLTLNYPAIAISPLDKPGDILRLLPRKAGER